MVWLQTLQARLQSLLFFPLLGFCAQYQQEVGNHMGKPMLYFSFDGRSGSQGACLTFLCVSDSSNTHCSNILLQAHGLKTPHHVPTTSPTLAACSSQEAAACKNQRNPNKSKTKNRLTKAWVCRVAWTLNVTVWPPGPNIRWQLPEQELSRLVICSWLQLLQKLLLQSPCCQSSAKHARSCKDSQSPEPIEDTYLCERRTSGQMLGLVQPLKTRALEGNFSQVLVNDCLFDG